MGKLTEDMTRLRGEVDALRGARGALMNDLTRGTRDLTTAVAAMRRDFTSTHAAMAKQTRGEREAFVVTMIREVDRLLEEDSRNRKYMARKGRHDRGVFLTEMRRQVTGLCKGMADDLMGARFAWRGESPGKSRPVQMKKDPVVVKLISPPVAAALKKTVTAPVIKAEKPPVIFMEPLKKGEKRKAVAAPEAPAVETSKVKAQRSVSTSMPFQKSKEKHWQDRKPIKTAIKGKRR